MKLKTPVAVACFLPGRANQHPCTLFSSQIRFICGTPVNWKVKHLFYILHVSINSLVEYLEK